MQEVMLFLADNYVVGVVICCTVVVIGYIVFSVLLIRSARKIGYDLGVSGMIPFLNVILWFKKKLIQRRIRKDAKLSKGVSSSEEVPLW